MSVPHTPTASVCTSTGPSAVGWLGDVFEPGRARRQRLHRERLHRARLLSRSFSSSPARGLPGRPIVPPVGLSARTARRPICAALARRDGAQPVHRPGPAPAPARAPQQVLVGDHLLLHGGMARQVVGGVDERHVGEGLGEVAHLAPVAHVVLLGEQPEVVAQADEPVEHGMGVVVAADQVETVRHPERAGQEGALVAGEPVDCPGVLGAVAQHEAVLGEPPLDGLDGGAHPLVGGGQEAHERDHEEAGVERVGPVVLREGPDLCVVALGAHLLVDAVAQLAPLVERGRPAPNSSMVRTARSTATQAMTLEWVKCRRGPRTSQMPSSGSSQWSATNFTSATCRSQADALRARCPPRTPRTGPRAPRRTRPAGTGPRRRCPPAPGPIPRSPAASRPPTRRGAAPRRART